MNTSSRHAALAALSARFGFSIAETLAVPAVFDKFAEVRGAVDQLLTNAALGDYFCEVVAKVAASPEGQQVARDFAQSRGEAV